MKIIAQIFGRGLVALLPLMLTLWGLYYLFRWLNQSTNALLHALVPNAPAVPGLGIVAGAVLIFGLGLLMSSRVTRHVYEIIEIPFRQLPVIKELYMMIKQLTEFLTPREGVRGSGVVRVRHPDLDLEMVGLLVREDVEDLPEGMTKGDRVGVYLPMSYQLGGYTVFVPRSSVEPLDISIETAMRETLTAWLKEQPQR